jgi:hypothetical protein
MMDQKNRYFLLAPTAVAAAIVSAYGTSVVMSDAPVTGAWSQETDERTVRPLPPVMSSWLNSMIAGEPCVKVVAKGKSCNPSRINYVASYARRRGQVHGVVRFPKHDVAHRFRPVPQAHIDWLTTRLNAVVCTRVNQRYGAGTCDAATDDFRVRIERTGRSSSVVAEVDYLTFSTGSGPPSEPPQEDI